MKEWMKRVWHDPVWSKVISAIIIAILGVVYSIIRGWLSDTETIPETLMSVFTYKANVWITISAVLIILAIIGIVKKKDRIPQPPFVKGFTSDLYMHHVWTWRWQWSKTFHFYYIDDLSIRCSKCKDGVMTEADEGYMCGKCGNVVSYLSIGVDPDVVKKQILADTREKYSYWENYVGEVKTGYVKS